MFNISFPEKANNVGKLGVVYNIFPFELKPSINNIELNS